MKQFLSSIEPHTWQRGICGTQSFQPNGHFAALDYQRTSCVKSFFNHTSCVKPRICAGSCPFLKRSYRYTRARDPGRDPATRGEGTTNGFWGEHGGAIVAALIVLACATIAGDVRAGVIRIAPAAGEWLVRPTAFPPIVLIGIATLALALATLGRRRH